MSESSAQHQRSSEVSEQVAGTPERAGVVAVAQWLASARLTVSLLLFAALWPLVASQFPQFVPLHDLLHRFGFGLGHFAAAFDMDRAALGWPLALCALVLALNLVARRWLRATGSLSVSPSTAASDTQDELGPGDWLVLPPRTRVDDFLAALQRVAPRIELHAEGGRLRGGRAAWLESAALAAASVVCLYAGLIPHLSAGQRARVEVRESNAQSPGSTVLTQIPSDRAWTTAPFVLDVRCGPPGPTAQARTCVLGEHDGVLAWEFPLSIEGWTLSYESISLDGTAANVDVVRGSGRDAPVVATELGRPIRLDPPAAGAEGSVAAVFVDKGPDGLVVGQSEVGGPAWVQSGPAHATSAPADVRAQEPRRLHLRAHRQSGVWWAWACLLLGAAALGLWLGVPHRSVVAAVDREGFVRAVALHSANRPRWGQRARRELLRTLTVSPSASPGGAP